MACCRKLPWMEASAPLVEFIMFCGLGFLAASLLALILLPFVHARAVRLTTRRILASTPVTLAEVQADKDQLRAEFAISTRRLEMNVEQLRSKSADQLADIGRKAQAANQIKVELREKNAAITAARAREKSAAERQAALEQNLEATSAQLRETQEKLSASEASVDRLGREIGTQAMAADSTRIEMVALGTQISSLQDRIAELEQQLEDTEEKLGRERHDAAATKRELALHRSRANDLDNRIVHMEGQHASHGATAAALNRRVTELESGHTAQERNVAALHRDRDQLRADLASAQRIERDLRDELASLATRTQAATQALLAEKAAAEAALGQMQDERGRLQREIAKSRREADNAWGQERQENALLRDRINDVAAEVVRLSSALDGPSTPLDAILAGEPHAGGHSRNGGASAAMRQGGSLADRIRALQGRAPRLS